MDFVHVDIFHGISDHSDTPVRAATRLESIYGGRIDIDRAGTEALEIGS